MNAAQKCIAAINRHGLLLVFPIKNEREPASLWYALHPRSAMRWDWSEDADPRVVSLWHLKTELGESHDVVYTKWFRGRATFFSRPVFTACMRLLNTTSIQDAEFGTEGAELFRALMDDSPQTPRMLRAATGLEGRPQEAAFNRGLKQIWERLAAVGRGELDEGAFPALQIGATKWLFEDLWDDAANLSEEEAMATFTQYAPSGSPFWKHMKRLRAKLGLTLALLCLSLTARAADLAITIDDFNLSDGPRLTAQQKDEAILAALAKHKVQAALFVTTKFQRGPFEESRLKAWDTAGHVIANHTQSHKNLNGMTADAFNADILAAEKVLAPLPHFQKIFRFPMLKEGDTAAKRDAVRTFLAAHGYKQGPVTIDTSDWYIASRLSDRLKAQPQASIDGYRTYYIEHVLQRAEYYASLAKKVVGHDVPHTILLHHNLALALFLDDLIRTLEKKGWHFIAPATAFADPVLASLPKNVPAGESLIWALAKETGRFDRELRYPGESDEYEAPLMDARGL